MDQAVIIMTPNKILESPTICINAIFSRKREGKEKTERHEKKRKSLAYLRQQEQIHATKCFYLCCQARICDECISHASQGRAIILERFDYGLLGIYGSNST